MTGYEYRTLSHADAKYTGGISDDDLIKEGRRGWRVVHIQRDTATGRITHALMELATNDEMGDEFMLRHYMLEYFRRQFEADKFSP